MPDGRVSRSLRCQADARHRDLPPCHWTEVEAVDDEVSVHTTRPVPVLYALCRWSLDRGVDLPNIRVTDGAA